MPNDSSKDGAGEVLLQLHGDVWRPVARSYAGLETECAQIEKEALGIVFRCEKFHGYIWIA